MSGKESKKEWPEQGRSINGPIAVKNGVNVFGGKLHRQGNKSIIRDELKEIDND